MSDRNQSQKKRFGVDIGTRTAILGYSADSNPMIINAQEGQETIPVRMNLSSETTQVGYEVDPKSSSSLRPGQAFGERLLDLSSSDVDVKSLPIVQFLAEAKSIWETHAPTETFDSPEVLCVVPAGIGPDERKFITSVFNHAGFSSAGVVRSPIPTTIIDRSNQELGEPLVVANIGSYWLNAAVLTPKPDAFEYEIHSRICAAGVGVGSFEEAIVEWLLANFDEQLSNTTFSELLPYVVDAVERLSKTSDNQVEFTINGKTVLIDGSVIHRALETTAPEIKCHLKDLFSAANLSPEDISDVVISGGGSMFPIVQQVFEGYFGQQPRNPDHGTPVTAPTLGASLLAQRDKEIKQVDNLLYRDLTVEVISDKGIQARPISNSPISVGESQSITLQTTVDDQIYGKVRIGGRHLLTGETEPITTAEITGLPMQDAGSTSLELTVTPHNQDPTDISCEATICGSNNLGEHIEITKIQSDFDNGPWFALSGVDLNAVSIPTRDSQPLQTTPDDYSDINPIDAIDRVFTIRNELWTVIQNNGDMSADDLQIRLEKLDLGLKRAGVDVIDPEIGEQVDDRKHLIRSMRPSNRPEGEIIEVTRPGYQVGNVVEEAAHVAISSGPTEDISTPEDN
ncbi:nucleotide exchange factor GrpE [Salinarchaeum sp. IM2453]|uniref:nucleotide exchange factor GrpE n=1 Tax=Salinarchaeum sp. IM2453 TaxID=2862870 RepID=UPI001C8367B5|nr:nucleotide exchange factor GrpE [Salinarchaeum sp. IM2453]QZA87927.1 nucleotide exchange factor GrpE [Salinarchaeum sp. IM2453]